MAKTTNLTENDLIKRFGERAKNLIQKHKGQLSLENINDILERTLQLKNDQFDYSINAKRDSIRFYTSVFKEYKPLDDPDCPMIASENQETDYCRDPLLYVEAFAEDSEHSYCVAAGVLDMDDTSQRYVIFTNDLDEQKQIFKAMVDYYIDISNTIVSRFFYDVCDMVKEQLRYLTKHEIQDRGFE